jgi:hypothetical protein
MARSGGFWAGVVFTGAALGAVIATGYFVATDRPVTHDNVCAVTANGETYVRTAEQTNYAALIAAVGARRELNSFASTIGIATAMQESGLRNLDYGDRDSLGLFQQRPSQGWGTEEEVRDPHHAALVFYWRLKKLDGWQDMRVTDAAQAVQRSGFPEAYEKHADEAAAWAAAFRGDEPFAAVNCDLDAVAEPSTAKAFADRVDADWGEDVYEVAVVGRNDRAVLLGITAASGSQQDLDAIANWAVGVAPAEAVASVVLGDEQWLREQGVAAVPTPGGFQGVLVGVVESLPSA